MVHLVEQPVETGHANVVVARYAGAKELCHARRLLGNRCVRRAGAHYGDVPHLRHRHLRRNAQDARDGVVSCLGQDLSHKAGLALACARPQGATVRGNQALEDLWQVGVGFVLTEHHLGETGALLAVGVQLGKAKVFIAGAILAHARASPSDWFMEPVW
mgnify:CR=1 FL=1